MSQQQQKAELVPRVLAALIDGLISWVPSFIPVIGGLVGTAYILTKDAFMYEITKDTQWKNRSIGKKFLRLEVATETDDAVGWTTSVRRNITLCLGTLIMVIPVIGWLIGPIVALLLSILEIVLVLTDPAGRRLGDRFANTTVVPERSASFGSGLES